MDYIQLRKRTVIRKYHDSDIFNLKNIQKLNKTSNTSKNRTLQSSLEKTKDDIFGTSNSTNPKKIQLKRKKIYIQNYLKTDIFNSHFDDSGKKKNSKPRINKNDSSNFDGIFNNEEYKSELNNYTKIHRSKKKEYDADKYFDKLSAAGRYYNELYGIEKSRIFPLNSDILSKTMRNSPNKKSINNSVFRNHLNEFEARKKKFKKGLIYNNTESNLEKKMNVSYNKKKVDLYGYNLDNKNNKNIIKEKDGIKSNSKLYKQLDYESNIFYEQNKDIKTKMFNYIKNKNEEKENKRKLKEKIKKEKEEINNKINEQNKKKSCLNKNIWGGTHCKWQKSNMDWKDPGAQVLFKKIDTERNLNNNKGEISAFQRKLKDLADSEDMDILSERIKPIDIDKYRCKTIINQDDNNVDKTEEILNTMPNSVLRLDQKLKVIGDSTTSNFLNNSTNENLSKMVNRVNTNIKSARLSKNKKKNPAFIKIMGKNSKINNKKIINNQSSNKLYDDYSLIYSTKSINTLDKFNTIDIKKLFANKGIHIFDVKKNELGIGNINKIKFKIRDNGENNIKDLEDKINLIEIDLNKNKYKVSIKKEENTIKKLLKNNKETIFKNKEDKTTFIKRKKNLISQFPAPNLKYKNNYKK